MEGLSKRERIYISGEHCLHVLWCELGRGVVHGLHCGVKYGVGGGIEIVELILKILL